MFLKAAFHKGKEDEYSWVFDLSSAFPSRRIIVSCIQFLQHREENREDGRFCEQLSDVGPMTLKNCVSVSGHVHKLHILPLEFVGAWLIGWPLLGICYLL